MNNNKITPCIWLSDAGGKLSEIIEYYKNAFENDIQISDILSLGQTPSGYTEICDISIFGRKYTLMNTEKAHNPLNDAVSFIINCRDQQEIDRFWDYFTREGAESQCGWCIDKYGIRWQIIPDNLGELMRKPNSAETMMKQRKIIIEEY